MLDRPSSLTPRLLSALALSALVVLAAHRPTLAKGFARIHLGQSEPALAVPVLEDALAALPAEGSAELRAELELLLTQAHAATKTRP